MTKFTNTKSSRVCFSYAAYAKNLMHHLNSTNNIPIEPGLSDSEFSHLESSLNFTFPPDLRSILKEGLPVGPGFPNWRSSSKQQLKIITNLPILGIRKEVSKNEFWVEEWGEKPDNAARATELVNTMLKKSPILVPLYRHFYIPTTPFLAGNPVFYVHGVNVRVWSYDIAGFFQKIEFCQNMECGDHEDEIVSRKTRLSDLLSVPAWAATEARVIEFWTGMAGRREGRVEMRAWWSGDVLGGCLEGVCGKLRDGGWKEEDVREMMMMDGCDESEECYGPLDRECVAWRVRIMSLRLLRAGWSLEDVVDTLGSPEEEEEEGDCFFDFALSKL